MIAGDENALLPAVSEIGTSAARGSNIASNYIKVRLSSCPHLFQPAAVDGFLPRLRPLGLTPLWLLALLCARPATSDWCSVEVRVICSSSVSSTACAIAALMDEVRLAPPSSCWISPQQMAVSAPTHSHREQAAIVFDQPVVDPGATRHCNLS